MSDQDSLQNRHHLKSAPMWLLLLELRIPLVFLVITYAISVLGLVLIPGQTSGGIAYSVSFLDAFYIVSYTATTIGFGELPHPFTTIQKIWMLGVMYSTVIAWLYAIGSILGVLSDPTFRRLRLYQRAMARIRAQRESYWIVCGFGGSGSQLVRFLDGAGIRCVVIDVSQSRIDLARLESLTYELDVLLGDAAEPQLLVDAGVQSPLCRGVLALTDQDQINLTVSTNVKILAPQTLVYSRSDSDANTRNLRSFDTEVVIDPFRIATRKVIQFIQKPNAFSLYQELVDPELNHIEAIPIAKPGHWIVCASGRLADLLCEAMMRYDVSFVLVSERSTCGLMADQWVRGCGTEAHTLREARIDDAAGILAATDDDGDNFSILLTAQAESNGLVTIGRRNRVTSEPVFKRADFSFVLREGRIIAQEMYARIQTPLLHQFLAQLASMPEPLVLGIFERLSIRCGGLLSRNLDHFDVALTNAKAPGFLEAQKIVSDIVLEDLLADPSSPISDLPLLCLLVVRINGDQIPFPGNGLKLKRGDQLLLWGNHAAGRRLDWSIGRADVLIHIHRARQKSLD